MFNCTQSIALWHSSVHNMSCWQELDGLSYIAPIYDSYNVLGGKNGEFRKRIPWKFWNLEEILEFGRKLPFCNCKKYKTCKIAGKCGMLSGKKGKRIFGSLNARKGCSYFLYFLIIIFITICRLVNQCNVVIQLKFII